jgi:hypothetical protein
MAAEIEGRFDQRTLLGICASIVSAGLAAGLTKAIGLPDYWQSSITAGAIGVPAAIELYVKSHRRDPEEDVALLRQGELRRPIAPVVIVEALLLTIVYFGSSYPLFLIDVTNPWGRVLYIALTAAPIAAAIVIALRASHYFGSRPNVWTSVAVFCATVFAPLVFTLRANTVFPGSTATDLSKFVNDAQFTQLAMAWTFGKGVVLLVVCLIGVRFGRARRDKFLRRLLARAERKVARTKPVGPSARRAGSGVDAKAAADDPQLSKPDPFEKLRLLAELKEAGAITKAEFRAKKAQILDNI